jgi:hypothetical protein
LLLFNMLGAIPASIQSSSAQQLPRRLQPQPLRDLGAETDMEVGLADPHPMQNACQLPAIRSPHARKADHFLTRSSRLAAASQSASRTADAAFIVDGRAGLVSPRRQAKMRADRSRSREAPRVTDPDLEREGRNGTDTRHRHQATADRIMLNLLQEHSMQSVEIARRTSSIASMVITKIGSHRSSSSRTRAS